MYYFLLIILSKEEKQRKGSFVNNHLKRGAQMSKYSLYLKAFRNVLYKHIESSKDMDSIKQIVFYGVKMFNDSPKAMSYGEAFYNFQLASYIQKLTSLLTPKDFMNIFPIEKDFKGYKCETKDYFYTMDYINKLDQDKPIGEEITEFFWEYQNWEITLFNVHILNLMSDVRRYEGKTSLAEEWSVMNGIQTYTLHKDNKGIEFLIDKEGKATRVQKPKPKHLKLVN